MRKNSLRARVSRLAALLTVSLTPAVLGCATTGANVEVAEDEKPADFGVLVMAHGGNETWNEAVLEAAHGIGSQYPVQVALGMASAESLQEATKKLEAQGVRNIGVVRLFVSGESWLDRTQQILGIAPGAPSRENVSPHPGDHHDFAATFWRVETSSGFAISREGLSEADEMSQVLLDRARGLSVDALNESVLILAHGPGDNEENERWITNLKELAAPLEAEFKAVAVHTLREDWPDKRKVAEARIRSFVETASEGDGRCLVIPFRVFGLGPYAEVLEGLDYESDGRGLLPHEAVSVWMRRQAQTLMQGPFAHGVSVENETSGGSAPQHSRSHPQ